MKILFRKILERLGKTFFRKSEREKRESEIREEIKSLKDQILIISNIVKDQSGIIVSLAKTQSDLYKALSALESNKADENCFLIKIPLSIDETVN